MTNGSTSNNDDDTNDTNDIKQIWRRRITIILEHSFHDFWPRGRHLHHILVNVMYLE